MNYTIKNNPQGTQEWLDDRKLHLTASNAKTIAVAGKGLDTLCKKLVMESKSNFIDTFSSDAMMRGNELEPEARNEYIIRTCNMVEEIGFCELDEYTGASPDGLVGKNGLIEIKCLTNPVYVNYFFDRKIKPEHIYQMQMQMWVIERKWCDYVVYNPNYEANIVIERIERNDFIINEIALGVQKGKGLIKKYLEEYEAKIQN